MSVTLPTALFLSALAFSAWVLGYAFDHPEFAVIGAVIIIGIGVMISTGGLERQTGKTKVTNATTNTTTVSYNYQRVETPDHLPLGALVMLFGGVGVLQSINRLGD